MKTLSIALLLTISLSLAWVGFAPQVVDASAGVVGAGSCASGPPCDFSQGYPCNAASGCCSNYFGVCYGSGGSNCVDAGHPCAGESYCYEISSENCI